MAIKEQLKEALARLGPNGENWVGEPPIDMPGKHCAVTALSMACGQIGAVMTTLPAYKALIKQLPGRSGLGEFNDSHTFADVKALFERAIEAAS